MVDEGNSLPTIVSLKRSCAVCHFECCDGGMVEFSRDLSQLFANFPPTHLLVQAGGVAVRRKVGRSLTTFQSRLFHKGRMDFVTSVSLRISRSKVRARNSSDTRLSFWET